MINIFILNWNSTDSIKECLNSILLSDDKKFRVILINNFSSDSDQSEIRSIYFFFINLIEIYLIENEKNLGYAGGNNSGINFLKKNNFSGDILILNPDIVISKNTISEMKKGLSTNVGIVTTRTLNPQGEILYDSIKLKGFLQKNLITKQQSINTDYAQGACMLIKREIFDEVGIFDERFFLYWEEVDFSFRVKSAGYKLVAITSTVVKRKNNSSSYRPLAFYYSTRNVKLLKNKYNNLFSNLDYIIYLLYMLLLILKHIIHPHHFIKLFINYFSGIRDSFLNIYNMKNSCY